MAHRAPPDDHRHRLRMVLPGQRTRVIVAVIAAVLGVGTPVAVWGTAGLIVDGQPARPSDDPAGLGITGALPGDPLPSNPLPGDPLHGDLVPGDLVPGDGVPGFPPGPDLPEGPLGIPGVVLGAYQRAEQTLAASRPGCHLSWSVLAGIGRIESGHARGGRLDTVGNTLAPILGLPLDGSPGVAAIADTDRGALDQDTVWDRAVGPMQFIPTSWRSHGIDANRDGLASPHNVHDATAAAGQYLCAGNGDLSDPAQLQAAVFRYNHSATYVTIVLRWAQAYRSGVIPTPPAPGPVPPDTNGGPPIVVDSAPQAAAPQAVAPPAAVAQPAPPPADPPPPVTTTPPTPATTSSPPAPPPVTTTTPTPVTTTTPPSVTTTTPTPVTAPPPATATTPPTTTTSPAPDSSPSPLPPPPTTTTPVEPASGPPPLAAL